MRQWPSDPAPWAIPRLPIRLRARLACAFEAFITCSAVYTAAITTCMSLLRRVGGHHLPVSMDADLKNACENDSAPCDVAQIGGRQTETLPDGRGSVLLVRLTWESPLQCKYQLLPGRLSFARLWILVTFTSHTPISPLNCGFTLPGTTMGESGRRVAALKTLHPCGTGTIGFFSNVSS